MNKKILLTLVIIVFLILISVGCFDGLFDTSTTYTAHPTRIRYDLRYGYTLTCVGSGSYEIHYDCDKPSLLQGSISAFTILYDNEYTLKRNNTIIAWNVSGTGDHTYELGVSASVIAQGYLVADLTGAGALTVENISMLHPQMVRQYTREQTLDDEVYIDPYHAGISSTAASIAAQAKTSNVFNLAQALFVWLKENTEYQVHENSGGVQPASETYQLKTGDCDDLSFLYISMCRSLEIPARFIRGYLIDTSTTTPTIGPHAWTEVFVGGTYGMDGWIPVECACGTCTESDIQIHQNFGVEDPMHLRLFIDDGSNESINQSLTGISWVYTSTMDVTGGPFNILENYTVLESQQLVVTADNQRSYS